MNLLDAVLVMMGVGGLITIGFGVILMGQAQAPIFAGRGQKRRKEATANKATGEISSPVTAA